MQLFNFFKYLLADKALQKEVKNLFYSDKNFAEQDKTLLNAYLFRNPYKISKSYLRKRAEKDLYTYGETPLTTYKKLANEVSLSIKDVFLELGSGRGRGAFFINNFYLCEVIGIERIPQFVKLSTFIVEKYQKKSIRFICGDMTKLQAPKASVVYLYGLSLNDLEISKIIDQVKNLPKGTRVITISYPLTDYSVNSFELMKKFSVDFNWGQTDAYIQRVC